MGGARKLPVKTCQDMPRGVPGRARKDMSGEECNGGRASDDLLVNMVLNVHRKHKAY